MASGTTKLTPRARQGMRTKAKIYKTAIKLFNANGYRNVTIREICKKSDTSIGVFYHYYDSKAGIITEMIRERDKKLQTFAQTLPEVPAPEKIMMLLRFYAQVTSEIGVDSIKVLYSFDNNLREEEKGGPRDDTGEVIMLIRDMIAGGLQKGEFLPESEQGKTTRYLAVYLRGLIYDWCRNNGDYDLEAVIDEYMTMFLQTFVAE